MIMELETRITLIFKDEFGNTEELGTTFLEILEKDISFFQEALEDNDNCSCFTEAQNHCECSPQFEDYGLVGFSVTT